MKNKLIVQKTRVVILINEVIDYLSNDLTYTHCIEDLQEALKIIKNDL